MRDSGRESRKSISTEIVLVPLADTEHETDLITLASAIAKHRGGMVDAVHIVTVPDHTSLESAAEHFEDDRAASQALLNAVERDAGYFGVPIETSTIYSHRSFEEIFNAARTHDADLVVMGWGHDSHGSPGRIENAMDDLSTGLPCDFIALKDRRFEPDHILVPTAGGPSSDLSAEIADGLRHVFGSDIALLHITEGVEAGEEFLEGWATEHGFTDATLRIESGDVDAAIAKVAADCSMVVVGATGRGLLSRLLGGSSVLDIVDQIECSIILAERPHRRSLRERLFGRR